VCPNPQPEPEPEPNPSPNPNLNLDDDVQVLQAELGRLQECIQTTEGAVELAKDIEKTILDDNDSLKVIHYNNKNDSNSINNNNNNKVWTPPRHPCVP
jgi:hypothetical protein